MIDTRLQEVNKNLESGLALGFNYLMLYGVYKDYPSPWRQECCCSLGSKCGKNSGKHPIYPWKKQKTAPTLRGLLSDRNIHRQEHHWQEPNWAIHLGRSNVVALDIDQHDGGADGLAAFKALTAIHGELPPTVADSRGHYLFRWPAGVPMPGGLPTKLDLSPGLEFLSGAHILVIPPSNHHKGEVYQWLPGCAPWESGIADLPQWVIDEISKRLAERVVEPKTTANFERPPSSNSNSPQFVAANVLEKRISRYLEEAGPAIEGQSGRFHTLGVCSNVVHGYSLTADEAWPHIQRWNGTCLPPWDDDELRKIFDDMASRPHRRGRGFLLNERKNRRYDENTVDGFPVVDSGPPVISGPRSRARIEANIPKSDTNGFLTGEDEEDTRHPSPPPLYDFSDLSAPLPTAFAAEIEREEEEARVVARRPTPSDKSERPAAVRCGYCKFMYHPGRNLARAGRLACGGWHCLSCSKKLKKIWSDNAENRIKNRTEMNSGKVIAPRADTVHVGTIPTDQQSWWRVRKSFQRIRKKGIEAEFIRIKSHDDAETALLCATVAFEGSKELTPADAAALVLTTIAAILIFGDTRKPISTSKGWRLPKKDPTGWVGIGPLPTADRAEIAEAMEMCGVENVCHRKTPHPFMPWVVDGVPTFDPDDFAENNWRGRLQVIFDNLSLLLIDGVENAKANAIGGP